MQAKLFLKLKRTHGGQLMEITVHRGPAHTCIIYVTARSAEVHVQRVEERAMRGGHSAPAEVIRDIYRQSIDNVPRMFELAK